VIRRVIQPREQAASGARLRLSAVPDGRPPVLELEGEFDLDTVPEIDRFLRRTLGPLYQHDHLVIDLQRTTFIDSSFIGFLVRLSAAQRAKRRELLLVRFETIDAAVQSVTGGRLPVIPPAFQAAAS